MSVFPAQEYTAPTNISSDCGCGAACSHVRHSIDFQFATWIVRLHSEFVSCNTSIDIAAATCEARLTFPARFRRVAQPHTTTAAHKTSAPLVESFARHPTNTQNCGTALLFRTCLVLTTDRLRTGRTHPPVPHRLHSAHPCPVVCLRNVLTRLFFSC